MTGKLSQHWNVVDPFNVLHFDIDIDMDKHGCFYPWIGPFEWVFCELNSKVFWKHISGLVWLDWIGWYEVNVLWMDGIVGRKVDRKPRVIW